MFVFYEPGVEELPLLVHLAGCGPKLSADLGAAKRQVTGAFSVNDACGVGNHARVFGLWFRFTGSRDGNVLAGGPPRTSFVHWDWNVCHNYHYGPLGVVDTI